MKLNQLVLGFLGFSTASILLTNLATALEVINNSNTTVYYVEVKRYPGHNSPDYQAPYFFTKGWYIIKPGESEKISSHYYYFEKNGVKVTLSNEENLKSKNLCIHPTERFRVDHRGSTFDMYINGNHTSSESTQRNPQEACQKLGGKLVKFYDLNIYSSFSVGGYATVKLWSRNPVIEPENWEKIGGMSYNASTIAALDGKLFIATTDNKLWVNQDLRSGNRISVDGWTNIGHAADVVAMTALNGKLFAVSRDNKLWVRDPVLYNVNWTNIGHAADVVAMTALNGKLFAVSRDNKLWVRDPVLYNVNWTNIGSADNIIAMTSLNGKLIAVSR